MQSNTLYKINLVVGGATAVAKASLHTDAPNAMAYHTGDNYMYAVAQKNNANGQVIRIGSDYVVQVVSGVTVATTLSITSGTIDPDGYFWVAWSNAQQYAKLDLRVGSTTYGQTALTGSTGLLTLNGNAQYYQINDWAAEGPTSGTFNRTGLLYTVAGQGGQTGQSTGFNSYLLSMTTANPPVWTLLGTYNNFNGGTNGAVTGRADWGAIYPSSDGYLYATENTTGRIYRFNLATPSTAPEFILQGPSGTTNDGARCVNAAVT